MLVLSLIIFLVIAVVVMLIWPRQPSQADPPIPQLTDVDARAARMFADAVAAGRFDEAELRARCWFRLADEPGWPREPPDNGGLGPGPQMTG
jgi:hypothetical protein